MSRKLLIVFVKNIRFGKVKTRLAKTVGNKAAFDVYKYLVKITEEESSKIKNIERHIYFSDIAIADKWRTDKHFIQKGENLGDRMKDAFSRGFDLGFDEIIGIGSDLPDLKSELIEAGFNSLKTNQTTFGPALDGGYYLFGMKEFLPFVFENKPWSKENLLDTTKIELMEKNISIGLLETKNDVDTIEDLRTSSIAEKFKYLYDLP